MVSASFLGLLALTACGDDTATKDPTTSDTGDDTAASTDSATSDLPCSLVANLEIVPLDAWGRDLGSAEVALDPAAPRTTDVGAGPGVFRVPFGDAPVTLAVGAGAVDHADLRLEVQYDGVGSFQVEGPNAGWVTIHSGVREIEGTRCPVTTLFLGLDHDWFAASGGVPTRNDFSLYVGGEEHWAAVAADLAQVRTRVTWSTWWWDSRFELERQGPSASAASREAHTLAAAFDALPAVQKRVLVNRFWDENTDWNAYLNTDAWLRDAALRESDTVELILQGNPVDVPIFDAWTGEAAPIDFPARVRANPRYSDLDLPSEPARVPTSFTLQAASWHQKAMVFDGTVAWVTGMNSKQSDWDTIEHRVFDPLRMEIDADRTDREDVADELSLADNEPRRDHGARIEGPAVRDVESILQSRWDAGRAEGALYADTTTSFTLDPAPSEPATGVPLQVVATMPPPWSNMSIAETHAKAFGRARDYIFIEDQYFRAPDMDLVIVDAMTRNPDLVLLVVTQTVASTDGGAKYTYLADATFRSLFPDRYLLLQLKSAELTTEEGWWSDTVEVVTEDIFLHSKLRMVDDRYLAVGSCNMNNRGYLYEGELDVAVLDTPTVRRARQDEFAQLVGPDWSYLLTDDARNNLDVLAMAAASNADLLQWWNDNQDDLEANEAEILWPGRRPSGFVYPLDIPGDYDWDVGPDAF